MTDQVTVENKLREWVLFHLKSDREVIFDSQNGDRPTGSYVMLNMIDAKRIQMRMDVEYAVNPAFDGTDANEAELEASPCAEWEWNFSVNAYSVDAMNALSTLKSAAEIDEIESGLLPLIVFNVSDIRRLPELINERWEERAQMDVALRGYVNTRGTLVDTIEEVNIEFNRTGHVSTDKAETLTPKP